MLVYIVSLLGILFRIPLCICDMFCQADCTAPLPLGGVLFPFTHPTGCRYCRFPSRSSCSPLADYVRPAALAYRVPLCLTPTLLLAAIFGCQATMLRDNLLLLYEFLLLGVKQLCCETTYCFRTNSYYYYYYYYYYAAIGVNGSP